MPTRSAVQTPQQSGASYRETLKATAITGLTNFAELGVQLIKSKVIALKVGPEGIGLFGILTAATGLISAISSFGITSSGVRQVAAASASDDQHHIARVVYTLRRTSLISGLLGMFAVLVFATPIARLTTGSIQYAWLLLLLGPLILFQSVSGGQTALLRGLRRIGDLARLRLIGAVAATGFAVPLVWFWGLQGIAPAMLMTSLAALAASWWYARRVQVPRAQFTWAEIGAEARLLFGLGAAFLLTSLQGPVVQNAFRGILAHHTDLHTVGQFLAALALSHTYVNFILQAMGMDYLPRLTQHRDNPAECNRLVNEQTEMALLIAVPGVSALVVLGPLLIQILYSSRFDQAIEVFRWQCLGVLLKVAAWPVGFVLVAKARRAAFLITETLANGVYVAAFYILVGRYGLFGAALSLPVMYLCYLPLILLAVRRDTEFRWSEGVRRALLVGVGAYTLAVALHEYLTGTWKWGVGLGLMLATAYWSHCELSRRLELSVAPSLIRWVRALTVPRSRAP